MTVKEHYATHLASRYSWYTGDFELNKDRFRCFCESNAIVPGDSGLAIDLGAGTGIQSIALAEIGFSVLAVDFNRQLLDELESKAGTLTIETHCADMRSVREFAGAKPELLVCCGDTLSHLESFDEISDFLIDSYSVLQPGGKLIVSFRDYSSELEDTDRFISVKNDSQRIHTCFLEYWHDRIRVTDLFHELENGVWVQKVSSYHKVRIDVDSVTAILEKSGFMIVTCSCESRMNTVIAEKQ